MERAWKQTDGADRWDRWLGPLRDLEFRRRRHRREVGIRNDAVRDVREHLETLFYENRPCWPHAVEMHLSVDQLSSAMGVGRRCTAEPGRAMPGQNRFDVPRNMAEFTLDNVNTVVRVRIVDS